MTAWLRRIHIWVGLFNLTVLVVFAITGITATVGGRGPEPAVVRTVDYEPPASFTDKAVADDLFDRLALPAVGRVPAWAVHRNEQNVLVLDFYGPNGVHHVTVREQEKQVTVRFERNSLVGFLNGMHETTSLGSPPDVRVRLWAFYVDLSIFSLVFMSITGVWLWLSSRPRLWWAQAALAAGTGLFAVLWLVTR